MKKNSTNGFGCGAVVAGIGHEIVKNCRRDGFDGFIETTGFAGQGAGDF